MDNIIKLHSHSIRTRKATLFIFVSIYSRYKKQQWLIQLNILIHIEKSENNLKHSLKN